jgi:hypothetical protein
VGSITLPSDDDHKLFRNCELYATILEMRKPALTDEHKATIAYFSMEIAVVPQIPT